MESFWIAISALSTLVLAFFTWRLAQETRDLVRSSITEVSSSERHHRESLSPYLVLELMLGGSNQTDAMHWIRGSIRNIGNGLATDIELYVNPQGTSLEDVLVYASLTRDERVTFDESYGMRLGGSGGTCPYHVALTFKNMFGERGWIVGDSPTGESKDFKVYSHARPEVASEDEWNNLRATYTYRVAAR